ncbi:NAD(P)/FAD-dependent oxidoreductase [Streptomyces sp. NPDC058773]|uniref:NAD(P)/FAD-dependent oxidoreductase n=1 Tax=Streptomyces sp. NPDC058773 TaxID=3346632 RepID=UPI0036739029
MKRAVVLGGSFAGLCAARVLSDHADEVVVLEADAIGEDGTGRGAPQRQQLHALLSMGHTQLERWFPGLTGELVAGGARLGAGPEVQFYVDGALKPTVPELRMLGATRPFLESRVRRRVMALPGVRPLHGRAEGLLLGGGRVRGVRYSTANEAPSTAGRAEELGADLVVDAMGRASRLGSWLLHDGWDAAALHRMRIDLGYATAVFRRGDELPGTVVAHASPGPASGYQPTLSEPGAMVAVEDDRWMVVLAGYTDHRPGRDPADFLARMRRCVPPLHEVADRCTLLGDVRTHHYPESRRRDFSGLRRFPGGLVAVGDSVASVNPIYGQGLTLAALQASCLSASLRAGAAAHEPAWDYFRRAAVVVDAAWQLSATADLAQPHVTGPYPRGYRLARWAGDKITEASVLDPGVNQAFMDVVHMRRHPKTLTRPRVLARAARVLAAR